MQMQIVHAERRVARNLIERSVVEARCVVRIVQVVIKATAGHILQKHDGKTVTGCTHTKKQDNPRMTQFT